MKKRKKKKERRLMRNDIEFLNFKIHTSSRPYEI